MIHGPVLEIISLDVVTGSIPADPIELLPRSGSLIAVYLGELASSLASARIRTNMREARSGRFGLKCPARGPSAAPWDSHSPSHWK